MIEYAAVYLNGTAIAVTSFPAKQSPIYINCITTTISTITWTTMIINEAEFETYMEFGMPYVATSNMRTLYIDSLTMEASGIKDSKGNGKPYHHSIIKNKTVEISGI